jgi:hypothetical protein
MKNCLAIAVLGLGSSMAALVPQQPAPNPAANPPRLPPVQLVSPPAARDDFQ